MISPKDISGWNLFLVWHRHTILDISITGFLPVIIPIVVTLGREAGGDW